MTSLHSNGSRSELTATRLFVADTDAHHDGIEALALTQVEFDAVRRPSVTGWRHFLRLQELQSAEVEFDLKSVAETLARLSWTPNDFLELLASVRADAGDSPAVAPPMLHRRLLGHLAQLKEFP